MVVVLEASAVLVASHSGDGHRWGYFTQWLETSDGMSPCSYVPSVSYGHTRVRVPPPPRGTSGKHVQVYTWRKKRAKSHSFLTRRWVLENKDLQFFTQIYSSQFSQIHNLLWIWWQNIKCKHTSNTKAHGEEGVEHHELARPSMNLSVQLEKKKIKVFKESYSKMLLQGWSSPSTPVFPARWGLLHWFISKKWSKRWLWINSWWSFPGQSQAKGLNLHLQPLIPRHIRV